MKIVKSIKKKLKIMFKEVHKSVLFLTKLNLNKIKKYVTL